MDEKVYIAIDLKSFYASVECVDRGLDPLKTNLVVADRTRTDKTICLAVSPSLKAEGVGGRPRLFEVVQRVKEVNAMRKVKAKGHYFTGKSYLSEELKKNPNLELDYIVAPPQMHRYMDVSAEIFSIYSEYISPDDIHVYSVDEVFIDATQYLSLYGLSAKDLCMKMIKDVLKRTGITATAGIGTNLYLCKIAMDIVAKKMPADRDGVRVALLDEDSYRRLLWDHKPITDFWRVGAGYAKRLAENGMFTMGDVARCSLGKSGEFFSEDKLYKLFGINAELLIDHAWGWEPTTIKDIKSYRPETNSISVGQVLKTPYSNEKARLILSEMADGISYDLVEKGLVTDRITINVGYDVSSVNDAKTLNISLDGDRYGRTAPKGAHGTQKLDSYSSSTRKIVKAATEIFDRVTNPVLSVRRLNVVCENIIPEKDVKTDAKHGQIDMFSFDAEKEEEKIKAEKKEKSVQKAVIEIRKRYGKNSLLKGMNLEEGATAIERNGQIGGHKA